MVQRTTVADRKRQPDRGARGTIAPSTASRAVA
jgi:hypothetical protein